MAKLNGSLKKTNMIKGKYRFMGTPDWKFPYLKKRRVYELYIREESKGLFGSLVGNTRPVIINPFMCPYSSWHTFYQNWKPVNE